MSLNNDEEKKKEFLLSYKPVDYSPRFMIFWCFARYIDFQQIERLLEDLGRLKSRNSRIFLESIMKYVDIELLRTSPIDWRDIWVYNYLKYDSNRGIANSRLRLIKKYTKEVFRSSETKAILKTLILENNSGRNVF